MTPALTEKLVETARAARDAGHGNIRRCLC